jgi:uncharacterized protein (TIGR03083 family)
MAMAERPQSLGPIFTAHLFPKLERMLIELLQSLGPDDWEKQTISPKWKVKDVAAHLLDTQLRALSMVRDGYSPETPNIKAHADLAAFINRLNEDAVSIYRRLSPTVLISLMDMASKQLSEYHASLDPFALAPFPVSWAGEDKSANWFNTARELTERWHHQQQIRLALNRPGIMTPEFYYPVLDCFMRALPFTYRDVRAKPEALVQFNVSGECGGSWYLYRDADAWQLVASSIGKKVSEITIPQEIAWRIFTKGIDKHSARAQIGVAGDTELGLHILSMIAIVA